MSANIGSEKTLKVDSSNNDYTSANANLDSEATVKVNSNGEPEVIEADIMFRKKRKVAEEVERSRHRDRNLSQQTCDSVGIHSKAHQHLVGDERNADLGSTIPEFEQGKRVEESKQTSKAIPQEGNFMHLKAGTTASFDYMLCNQKFASTSFQQQGQGATTSTPSFSGFKKHSSSRKGKQSNEQLLGRKINIDITEVFLPEIDHTQTTQTPWANYLDEARKNYFFYGDDIPTLRLFENHDDCGNEIKEPELWRPLQMDSDSYERKIEAAKKNGPVNRNEGVDNSKTKKEGEGCKSTKFEDDFSSMEKEFPGCCAQPHQSQSYTCKSPRTLTAVRPDGSIIDLTSPKADGLFQWNREQTCYSPTRLNNNFSIQSKSHGSYTLIYLQEQRPRQRWKYWGKSLCKITA